MTKDNILVVDQTVGGQIQATLRKQAMGMHVQGSLCLVPITTEYVDQLMLGRVNTVDTLNIYHANPAFGPIKADQGNLEYFSQPVDVLTTVIDEIAVYDNVENAKSGRKSNPSSGTPIVFVDPDTIKRFLNEKVYYMSIGHQPSFPDVDISVINKQFCRDETNLTDPSTYNQARHKAVIGQNGSGKTVLAATLIAGSAVAHPNKGFLIPDTKGDFAKSGKFSDGDFEFDFHELLRRGNRSYTVIKFQDIRIESPGVFKTLFARLLKDVFTTVDENAKRLAESTCDALFPKATTKGVNIEFDVVMRTIMPFIEGSWSTNTGADKADRFADQWGAGLIHQKYEKRYNRDVKAVFEGNYSLRKIIYESLVAGKFIILDIDIGSTGDLQEVVMRELFREVKNKGRQLAREEKTANAEIVLDEAPRWVPQSNLDSAGQEIIDASKTTRAYGIGWTIIGQSLSGLNNEILRECHTKYFGRGLGLGADGRNMMDFLGKSGMDIYNQLQNLGGFFFVAIGHELNLGSGNLPLAISTYGGDATNKIIDSNSHIWVSKSGSWGTPVTGEVKPDPQEIPPAPAPAPAPAPVAGSEVIEKDEHGNTVIIQYDDDDLTTEIVYR